MEPKAKAKDRIFDETRAGFYLHVEEDCSFLVKDEISKYQPKVPQTLVVWSSFLKLVVWSVAFENAEEARRKYENEFHEEAPPRQTIHRWVRRFLETGDINKRNPGSERPVTASGDRSQTTVEEAIRVNPHTSVRDCFN